MKVTYLAHSGFLVEMKNACFLFDYYTGAIPELPKEKPLVVFVSHSHSDHYNREIYQLLSQYPGTQYVLAKDIPVKRLIAEQEAKGINLGEHIKSLRKDTKTMLPLWNHTLLTVTTLKSTDAGVAFLLEYENRILYHAGDLNLWYWEGESRQTHENMERTYRMELEKLREYSIDLAFVPLDPRLEGHAFDGMRLFLEYTDTKWTVPMHMWGDYGVVESFIERFPEYESKLIQITYEGKEFTVE